ncbi:hypothetical protein GCM10027275_01780 [Rhabdobacter roseus]|uniref:ADP-ribose pyrophosphatase YjhB (NUDIX family) n=1 Tax=Rhabdobacter roseus TaxID=1655419 RepID=A0A840TLG4_9BACT|nr:NUDIX hydrolase [Rhabdobacter roseus]MBB5282063.1 ADP-ribose pyrophosphatase YjhB (NUDIX family) [Rhabdobacter roseus]
MKVRPAALIIENEKILTMRYRYGSTDVYALPGGNPDPGESLTEALQRELREELGVATEVQEMVLCGEVLLGGSPKDTLHTIFRARLLGGTPGLDPEHTTALELVWVPRAELGTRRMYPHVGKYLQRYLEGNLPMLYLGPIAQPYVAE